VLVPYEKDPSFLMIQGGRGGIGGGGIGSGDGGGGLVYRPLTCVPYSVPAHLLLLRRTYAVQEFHALWNRFGASWQAEVRFRAGIDLSAIASALSSTRFVPVIKSINPQTLHVRTALRAPHLLCARTSSPQCCALLSVQMALCGCTWFGDQLFFTVSAAVGERGAVEAHLECRASTPLALRSFAGLVEAGWLSSLFIPSTSSSSSSSSSSSLSSSSLQRSHAGVARPAVESIRRGERSSYSHFISTSSSSPFSLGSNSSFFASPGNSASYASVSSNGAPSPSSSSYLPMPLLLSATAPPSTPPSAAAAVGTSIGSSLSSYGSGTLELDSASSSSAIPYSVLLHSRAGTNNNSKTILARWMDAYRA
jgi:hypothetical protein